VHEALPVAGRVEARLADDVGDLSEPRGEFFLVRGQPAAVLDDPGDGLPVEVEELLLLAQVAEERRVAPHVLVGPVHDRVEIGLDLEEVLEVLVELEEPEVDVRGSDEDHLDVPGYGLGHEAPRGHEAQALPRLLDAYLAVAYGALEALVGEHVEEHVLHREDEVAAVAPVDGPGPDHGEVGDERPELGLLFDASEQVVVGGVQLGNDGCPLHAGVVHQHVDLVALEPELSVDDEG